MPSGYYSSALVTALTTLAEHLKIDLRINKKMSIEDVVNCFVIAFEVPDLGCSDYLEIALPALCSAAEHLPVKGAYFYTCFKKKIESAITLILCGIKFFK